MLSAVYAAAQNLLLGARACGLGAAFTTFHLGAEDAIRRLLKIPDDKFIGVTMPLGWPAAPFGQLTRRPLEEVVHFESW
jgi:nitroreductase